MTDLNILQKALDEGMIDLSHIQAIYEMKKRQKYIAMNPYDIWEGADGKYHTYLPDEKGGRLHRKRKTRKELEDTIYKYWKEISDKLYFIDVVYEWLEFKLKYKEIYKQTYDKYLNDAKRFFVGTPIEKMEMCDITERYLELFIRQRIIDLELTNKAYSNMRTLLIGTFKYSYKQGYSEIQISSFFSNIDISQKVFKKRSKKPQVFTDTEVRMIEEFIHSKPVSATNQAILLGFYTGMRIGEIVALSYSDIDFDRQVIHVEKTEVKHKDDETNKWVFEIRNSPKTEAGVRDIYMCDGAMKVISDMRKINPFGEYIFQNNGNRIKGKDVTKKLYAICDQIKIPRRSMHKARKTCSTKMINGGVDESLVTEILGHTDIKTTKAFYYFNNADDLAAKRQIQRAINY